MRDERAAVRDERRARRIARGIFLGDLGLLLASGLLWLPDTEPLGIVVVLAFAVVGWGGVGALIASRAPGSPIGWLLLVAATAASFAVFAAAYSSWDQGHVGAALPLDVAIGWASIVAVGPIGLAAVPSLFLLYPDGALPSRRWRGIAIVRSPRPSPCSGSTVSRTVLPRRGSTRRRGRASRSASRGSWGWWRSWPGRRPRWCPCGSDCGGPRPPIAGRSAGSSRCSRRWW